jgi:pSer/pThr/pTyr-binding forkhead associated (FHA) protein
MARLILSKDGRERTVVLAAQTSSLGRAPDCTIVLEDGAASKRHCSIEKAKDSYVLRDLGSTNGTFLNDRPVIADMPLRHGDEILVGDTTIRFEGDYAVGSSLEPPPADGVVLARVKLLKRAAPVAEAAAPARPPEPPSSRGVEPARAPAPPPSNHERAVARVALGGSPAAPPAAPSFSDLLEPMATEATTRLDSLPELLPWVESEAPEPPPERAQAFLRLTKALLSASDARALRRALLEGALPLAGLERGVVFGLGAGGALAPEHACDRHGNAAAAAVNESVLEGVVARRTYALVPGPKGADAAVLPLVFQASVHGVLWVEGAPAQKLDETEVDLLALAAAQAATFLAALAPGRRG